MSALRFERVSKRFGSRDSAGGDRLLLALRDVDFEVGDGERVAIVGRSGSGKSTLLHLAAGIERPSSGRVLQEGRDLASLRDRELARLRRDRVGFVFQFFHLLPHLSVLENVALPARIAGDPRGAALARARELLARVGLADRESDAADALSGGEQQRVALCRALLRRPGLLLADEPTGSLDDVTGRAVMDLMLELSRERGSALVFVTHDRELAALADRVLELKSGELVAA
jgi:predicted ABC-type transport system involved in lysophospholipase L1 biosynthesis ATPase subunit